MWVSKMMQNHRISDKVLVQHGTVNRTLSKKMNLLVYIKYYHTQLIKLIKCF